MTIPFVKAHGAGNDFLLVRDVEAGFPALARSICDRTRGVGADGLILFTGPARIRLFDSDWRELGLEIEAHPHFPRRTNVSFVKVLDRHAIEVRFFERGAGPTLSSGTGSTGAAVAAILSGRAESPIRVLTEAGDLDLEW